MGIFNLSAWFLRCIRTRHGKIANRWRIPDGLQRNIGPLLFERIRTFHRIRLRRISLHKAKFIFILSYYMTPRSPKKSVDYILGLGWFANAITLVKLIIENYCLQNQGSLLNWRNGMLIYKFIHSREEPLCICECQLIFFHQSETSKLLNYSYFFQYAFSKGNSYWELG